MFFNDFLVKDLFVVLEFGFKKEVVLIGVIIV